MSETFSSFMSTLRKQADMTKTALAEKVGVSFTTIYKLELEKRKPPQIDMVRRIASALNASEKDTEKLVNLAAQERAPDEVGFFKTLQTLANHDNHDAPQSERRAPLPMYGEIPAGPPMQVEDAGEVYEVLEHQAKTGRYVLRVSGDSMAPSIQDGDLILMEYRNGGPLKNFHNKICAVHIDGDTTLKRVQVQGSHGREIVILKGDRPDYPAQTFILGDRDFEVIGIALKVIDRDLL